MTVTFTRTREQLATMVLGKLGVVIDGGSGTTAQAALCFEAIDLRLKEMHRLGTFWRKVTSVPVTFSLSASIATASAGAGDILFPIKCTFVNSSRDDPVEIIGRTQYAAIEDKGYVGNPTKVMWKGGDELIFWPVPKADGTAKLLYEKIADDTSAGAGIDVEVSMLRWMKDIIAYDIGDSFGVPEEKMNRFAKESVIAERYIRALGAEHVDFAPVQVEEWPHEAGGIRRDWRTG